MEWLISFLKMISIDDYLFDFMLMFVVIMFVYLITITSHQSKKEKTFFITFFSFLIILVGFIHWWDIADKQIANYSHQEVGYITIFDLNASQLKSIDDFYVKQRNEAKKQKNIYEANQKRKEELQKQKIIKEIK